MNQSLNRIYNIIKFNIYIISAKKIMKDKKFKSKQLKTTKNILCINIYKLIDTYMCTIINY